MLSSCLNVRATSSITTLSLHDALPICSELAIHRGDRRAERALPRRVAATKHAVAERHRVDRSEEHTSELQSQFHLVCRLLLEKKNTLTDSFDTTLISGSINAWKPLIAR